MGNKLSNGMREAARQVLKTWKVEGPKGADIFGIIEDKASQFKVDAENLKKVALQKVVDWESENR